MKKKNHGGGNSSIDNDYDHRRRLDPVDIRIVRCVYSYTDINVITP